MPRPQPQPQLPIKKRRKPGPIARLKGMVKTSTVMTEAILARLDSVVRDTGQSRADLIRVLVQEGLDRRGVPPVPEERSENPS
jgi:hypothetical protein